MKEVKKSILLSTAISVSVILSACDSATFIPESSEVDIAPITDIDGNIVNLLLPRATSALSCSTFHRIASATSPHSYDDDFKPSKAIDNNLSRTSRWSSKGTGKSITFDLGQSRLVTSIQTAWYKANLRTAYFDVDTSSNGSSWTNVLSSATAQGTEGLIAFDLQPTNARYVKIVGQGNSASSWNSLIEAKVAGCTTSQPTEPPNSPTGSIDLIESLFEVEGGPNDLDPVRGGNLVFNALSAKHVTPNGNGWRHEYKMAKENRRRMHQIDESLSATITPNLSSGSKTIVAQYHGGGLGTLVKLYISDTNERNLSDSRGDNGIFDLYARVKTSSSSRETVVKFGTIRSGESFDFTLRNNRGRVTVSTQGITETLSVADSDGAYLKFGNYLQAQDPITLDKTSDNDDWSDLYRRLGITRSIVTFSNVVYQTNN